MTKMTVDEAKEFINDHTDIDVVFDERLNFQSETKSLVLQDTDLDKLLAFIDDQEKEKQELKADLDKWKSKFDIGQEVWVNNKLYSEPVKVTVNGIQVFHEENFISFSYSLKIRDNQFYVISGNDTKNIFATKEEAEQAKEQGK